MKIDGTVVLDIDDTALRRSYQAYKAPTDIEVALLANATVLVNWRWEKTPGYEIKNFFIEYVKQTMDKMKMRKYICRCRIWYEVTGDMPTDPYRYVVDCLEPNYNYRFRVAAYFDEKRKVYSQTSRWMRLRMDVVRTTPLSRKIRRKMKKRMTTSVPNPNATTVNPRFGKIYEEGYTVKWD